LLKRLNTLVILCSKIPLTSILLRTELDVQGRENALVKIREDENLQNRLKEAVRSRLANGDEDFLAEGSEDGDDPDAQLGPFEIENEFDPVEA
jgi:hypothetical protein